MFIDSSTNNFEITAFGDVTVSNSIFKYGGGSAYFDGSGDYIIIANDAGHNFNNTDDFTIEGWIYFNSLSNGVGLISKGSNSTNSGWTFYYFNNLLYFGVPYVSNDINGTFVPILNTWYHLACSRSSGTIRLFINGELISSQSNNLTYATNEPVQIGRSHSNNFLNGYIDDIRVTKGIARYTSNFTPPQQQLPSPSDPYIDNVSLLLHMDGNNNSTTFLDSSASDLIVTAVGNASITTAFSKFGGSSAYFDGNGDYLVVPEDGNAIGVNDFTIECWINTINGADYKAIVSLVPGSDNNALYVFNNTISWYDGTDRARSASFSNGVWNHVAVTRSGTTLRIFLNGEQSASTYTTSANIANNTVRIGTRGSAAGEWFNGYIDELRMTKGIARYTSNFIPHTAPFSNPTIITPTPTPTLTPTPTPTPTSTPTLEFSPEDISGLRLWLDASTGLYDSSSGGNIVSSQGGVVARWEDLSGNDFHATGSSGPTLSLDQVNGKPSLVFTGSNFLQIPSILNGTSATAFVVVRPTNTSADGGVMIGNIGPAGHYPYRGGNIFDGFAATVRKNNITKPTGFFNWHLYNVISAPNDWRYIFNESVHFATTSNTYTGVADNNGPYIGKSISAGVSYGFVGAMAEIIVYNSALTQEQLDQVSEYLRQKYALPDPLPYHLLLEGPSSV